MKCHCRYNNPSYTIVYSCCIGTRLMSLRMRDCVSFGGNFEWKRVGTLFPLLERILDGNANNFQAKSPRLQDFILHHIQSQSFTPGPPQVPQVLAPKHQFSLGSQALGHICFRHTKRPLVSLQRQEEDLLPSCDATALSRVIEVLNKNTATLDNLFTDKVHFIDCLCPQFFIYSFLYIFYSPKTAANTKATK